MLPNKVSSSLHRRKMVSGYPASDCGADHGDSPHAIRELVAAVCTGGGLSTATASPCSPSTTAADRAPVSVMRDKEADTVPTLRFYEARRLLAERCDRVEELERAKRN
jgi:hypothetical protein